MRARVRHGGTHEREVTARFRLARRLLEGGAMDTWLRQRFWILDLATAGMCALLLGHAAAAWVEGASWLPAKPTPAVTTATTTTAPRPAPDKQTESIVARNVFCSACPAAGGRGALLLGESTDTSPRHSRLPLRLVAINVAVAPWSARYSSAVLRDTESQRVGVFAVHDRVKGAVVERIGATRVELDNGGRREFLDLLEGAAGGEGLKVSSTPPSMDALATAVERGVRKLGPYSYEVDRSALEAMLGDLGGLTLSARAVPESREGRAAGLRFVGVRPGGAVAKLGIESGDLVSSVNGLDLTSPEQGLVIYTKLKSVGLVEVGLERQGSRLTLEYRIR
jgi:type II secretory pathway component PulC